MPVPIEDSSTENRNSKDINNKSQKQATISSFFQRSSKRKKNDKRDSTPEKDEQEKKKLRIENSQEGASSSSSGTIHEESIEDSISTNDTQTKIIDIKKNEDKEIEKPSKKGLERCKECRQVIHKDEIKMFVGDPEDAVEEFVMLCDPRLSLLTGEEEQFDGYDDRPQHKITEFSVYDKCGHLAPFDTGLIDKNVELFFSGYIKPVYDETVDSEGGVCTKKMGPINEWWVSGFDGGENALIGFSTAFAEYILVQPTEEYAPYMNAVAEKICMSKILIELVLHDPEASYEELLNKIETTVPPESCSKLTEDSLLRHAQFLIEQVESYDSAAADYEEEAPLIASTCVRDLIKLAGVTLGKRRAMRGIRVKAEKKTMGPTLATTTPLVRAVFDTFFKDQLDLKSSGKRKRRCGVCDVCQQADCGKCRACKDMVKFGGTGRAKQCCINRRCPNMAVQEADQNNESQDEDNEPLKSPLKEEKSPKAQRRALPKITKTTIKWACQPHIEKKSKKMYKSVMINGSKIDAGDYVKVCPQDPTDSLYICRVCYMWEDTVSHKKFFHALWMYRAAETVIGESGDPTELFLCDDCGNIPIGAITDKCEVKREEIASNWNMKGGEDLSESYAEDEEEKGFTFNKWYDIEGGLFTDPPDEFLHDDFQERYCPCCDREKKREKWDNVTLNDKAKDTEEEGLEESIKSFYKSLTWRGDVYSLGDCVYVNPETFKFKKKAKAERAKVKLEKELDEELYPEIYRKSNDYIKGSNVDVAQPYRIACILQIIQTKGNYGDDKKVLVRLRKYYRPENTNKGSTATHSADLNLLYWSEEETTIEFETNVEGKCYVLYADDVDANVAEYTCNGPDRYYFKESYNADTDKFDVPPNCARHELSGGRSSKNGKGKAKRGASVFQKNSYSVEFPVYEKVERLRTLDIFAGCGGLSHGLHQVGVADSRWAVEFEPSAAQAYRLNNPGAVVFNADCNNILKMIMEGRETDDSGQRLPRKGEVDLLCGGPPCQGFSGMNRFNSREYSTFKNSLVVSYLSYCDYFRPRFFILENVRNFVSFKKGMVLKLVLNTLLKMGYQCEFGVLQAGSYGVAQTRRRAILIAAAPGEVLPNYPEPQHVFAQKGLSLSVMVDEKKYQALRRLHTAPYRTITVRDALGDLPCIKNGANKLEISYDSEPMSHFQKMMREKHSQQMLRDHMCKDMSPLVEARMKYIPCLPGSDWRDLPNISVTLRDGSTSKKLLYMHNDKKQGKSSNGDLRGVCACASGSACDAADRQFNTLIPWCLPHTSNRHNHWAGLYGRLEWDGFFSTTVTNPEPMGKQGRVLHPEQHRVVSVRECARSQGFPDSVRFYGSILDKHRQIGNAVAPPMAAAIGQEIRKAIVKKMQRDQTVNDEHMMCDSSVIC